MDLQKLWVSRSDPAIQKNIWDGAAAEYAQKSVPTLAQHSFLHLMEQLGLVQPDASVLDIGCGAGRLSLALAPHVGQVVGCDLSSEMIAGADALAKERKLYNAHFHCLDWHQASPEELGWAGQFDVVFAHHTPAIDSYETFDKMVRCARRACLFRMNTRRQDQVLSQAFAQIGLDARSRSKDETVAFAFAYLWEKGFEPNIRYHREVWRPVKTLESQIQWTLNRARLCRPITPEEEHTLAAYLSSVAEGGMVTETVTTTIVTMDWKL